MKSAAAAQFPARALGLFITWGLSIAVAGPASASAYTICSELDGRAKQTVITINNRCISSSQKYQGNTFKIDIDQQAALIKITGDYRYKAPASRIGTTDCAGAKRLSFRQPGADLRRYGIIYNGRFRGYVDHTQSRAKRCVQHHRFHERGGLYSAAGLTQRGFAKVDISARQPKSAPSLIGALGSLATNHPEAIEGRPTMHIETAPSADGSMMIVEVIQHGLLDDSVSAQRYIAHVKQSPKGWQLVGLWTQSMCARGRLAGQWTGDRCS